MKMNFSKLLIVSAFLLGVAGSTYAQPSADAREVSGAASFFRPIGSGTGALNLDATYGYSTTDAVQVGVRQSLNLIDSDSASTVWNAVTSPFLNYHFLGGDVLVPYIGGFLGGVWNDDDITGTAGPQGGVKMYISPSSFVGLNYRYEWFFEEIGDANETQNANHVATVGLGYTWGGHGGTH